MVEIRKPISVNEAINRVMCHVQSIAAEEIPLSASYGRILAEPVIAKHDVPSFHRAPYDGFAIRAEDSSNAGKLAGTSFRIVDIVGAGSLASKSLMPGEAVRIMTGAAMPEGSDAVVMLEQAQLDEAGEGFTVRKPFAQWENVSLQGEDARQGEIMIESGQFIHPGTIALLATFGYSSVRVAQKPRVGIISTGSELLEVHEPLAPGKIRNSNGPMIAAQLARMHLPFEFYGSMKDDLENGFEFMEQTLPKVDCLITTGGVSVGDFDYLPAIYEQLGAKVLFNKVAMRPGSVTTVAVKDGKLLFGLSGNPSACYTGFELLARPALLSMMGCSKPYLPYTKAVLAEDFSKANPFTRFVRAIYKFDHDRATIAPAGFNKSNAVSSIARGNAFIVLPGGTRGFRKGDWVEALLLGTEDGDDTWRI